MDRRVRELCYRCDEKYMSGHHCRQRDLQVLMVLDDEEEEDLITSKGLEGIEGNFLGLRKSRIETKGSQIVGVRLSLSSVVGLTSPKTMKLQGAIGEQLVVILIDSGATHNFISLGSVQKMVIPIEITKTYRVLLGTGSV